MTQTASDVIASRIQSVRGSRGWSAARLAAVCKSRGFDSITDSVVANIESGRRQDGHRRRDVTVDELMQLSVALSVPPVLLLLPWGDSPGPEILEDRSYDTIELMKLLLGKTPATYLNLEDLTAWRRGESAVEQLLAYLTAETSARSAFRHLSMARHVQAEKAIRTATRRYQVACQRLAEIAEQLLAAGLPVDPPDEDDVGDLAEVGVAWPRPTADVARTRDHQRSHRDPDDPRPAGEPPAQPNRDGSRGGRPARRQP